MDINYTDCFGKYYETKDCIVFNCIYEEECIERSDEIKSTPTSSNSNRFP